MMAMRSPKVASVGLAGEMSVYATRSSQPQDSDRLHSMALSPTQSPGNPGDTEIDRGIRRFHQYAHLRILFHGMCVVKQCLGGWFASN
jgi:hypothetical protein